VLRGLARSLDLPGTADVTTPTDLLGGFETTRLPRSPWVWHGAGDLAPR